MKMQIKSALLMVLLSGAGLGPYDASGLPAEGGFHGTVYQVDTVYNFVDVIMPGGTKRFFADAASVVHVHRKRAALIDISMGEEVRGTYRTDAKGERFVVKIDDLTAN